MSTRYKTLNQLRRAGLMALVEALGPVDATKFLRLFDPGSGDYTAERDRVLGKPGVDELLAEMSAYRRTREQDGPDLDE